MICPYCAEDVPANSQQHHGCRRIGNKQFPQRYLDFHGGDGSAEPVVLSVVGFPGHGKTVYLCALFDYLDNHLTYMWPERRFHNHVLDQESLSLLNQNRRMLRNGILPPPTQQNFPRPGIFRLTNMPHSAGGNGLPPLVDTTVLIYDPPGEAFSTEDKIVEFASFVKSSSCVLFLIDLTALGESIADEMALLLDTYLLGMRRMGIEKKSQHMVVVYTKSDEMKVSVPEFKSFLEREPMLKEYIDQQRPRTLADPQAHLRKLTDISDLLETFTWSELNAAKFINEAKDWFASVSYAVVSSLGAAPEKSLDGNGNATTKLTVKMSPRGVADPLLYVLAKSLKEPPQQAPVVDETPAQPVRPVWLIPALIVAAGVLAIVAILALLVWSGSEAGANQNVPANKATETKPTPNTRPTPKAVTAPRGMAYAPGGEFVMGSASGDGFERPPHKVAVKPFFIDLYEVTCADYARFVEQTGHAPPPGWRGAQYPQGAARRPVTGVSWDDAVAYARWANKRLPTEEEWEFAARGTDGRPYPWGKEWQAGMANAGGAAGGLADVGTFKGVSPFGLYDMIGNAWEWTADDLRPYPGGQLQVMPRGALKVIRGGSWQEAPGQATATYRGYLPARGGRNYSATGFRCAQDVAGDSVVSTGDGPRQ